MNLEDFRFYASMGGHYVTSGTNAGAGTSAHLKRKSFSSREDAKEAVINALKLLELYTEPEPYQTYTVWVDGVEVTDYLLTLSQANRVSQKYFQDGYPAEIVNTVEEKQ